MPNIVYENWGGGLDLRRSQSMSAQNVLYTLTNAYITNGKAVRKRPCAVRLAVLEAGTVGLEAGKGVLNTFHGSTPVVHADARFVSHSIPHPSTALAPTMIWFCDIFNTKLYVVASYSDETSRHFYDGTAVADVNCPHSRPTMKIGQKIYSASAGDAGAGTTPAGADVNFCAATDPTDWTTANDAGFLPSGIEAVGTDNVTALGNYRGDLAVFYSDSTQLWAVDPDPANNALLSNMRNVGTIHTRSPREFANDLAFLAKQGFRSMSLATVTDSLQENDIGSPIDKLRRDILDADPLFTLFFPTLGQLWAINGDTIYVLSYSKSGKITAWSVFTYPFTITAATILNNELYVRASDVVYRIDVDATNDDGTVPECLIDMFYQDNKKPGILKQFFGYDVVVEGTPEVAFRFDPRHTDWITDYVPVTGDTRPDALGPMELTCTSLAPSFRHQADEAFQLDLFQCNYEELGPV